MLLVGVQYVVLPLWPLYPTRDAPSLRDKYRSKVIIIIRTTFCMHITVSPHYIIKEHRSGGREKRINENGGSPLFLKWFMMSLRTEIRIFEQVTFFFWGFCQRHSVPDKLGKDEGLLSLSLYFVPLESNTTCIPMWAWDDDRSCQPFIKEKKGGTEEMARFFSTSMHECIETITTFSIISVYKFETEKWN